MSVTYKSGFTIIETMLFLAVTGVLVVAILAGTGTSINIQRYHDSVSTLKSVLEQQYSEVTTVRNEARATDLSCNSSAVIDGSGPKLPRGQSDCVVLGRYITIVDTAITISTVIGNTAASSVPTSDIAELQTYNLSLLPASTETSSLEWGARIAWPVSGGGLRNPTTPRTISLLILRSPTSGLTYTFSGDSTDTSTPVLSLKDMIKPGIVIPGQSERTICVDSDGGFGGGLAVFVGAYASNASFIEVHSNDMGYSSKC